MLTNIVFAGLIPGLMAKPIIQRRNATLFARGMGEYATYPVKPSTLPAAAFPVEEPTTDSSGESSEPWTTTIWGHSTLSSAQPTTTSKWVYTNSSTSAPWSTSTSAWGHTGHASSSSERVTTSTYTSTWAHSTHASSSEPWSTPTPASTWGYSTRTSPSSWAHSTWASSSDPETTPSWEQSAWVPSSDPTTTPVWTYSTRTSASDPWSTSSWSHSTHTPSSDPWSTSSWAHSTHTPSSDPWSSSWEHSTWASADPETTPSWEQSAWAPPSDPTTTPSWTYTTHTSASDPWSTSSWAHSTWTSSADPETTPAWEHSTWASSADPSTTSTWAHSSWTSSSSPHHSVPTVSTVSAGNQYAIKSSSAPHPTIATYKTPDAWVSPVHAAAQTPSAIPFDVESDSEPETWSTPTFASSVAAVTAAASPHSITAASVTAASEATAAAVGGQVGHLANGNVPAASGSCSSANVDPSVNANDITNVPAELGDEDQVDLEEKSAAAKIKAAKDKANHHHGAPVVSAQKVSFEACMRSCKGKFQHADIAFDISQGKMNCAEECARYDSASIDVAPQAQEKRAAPLASHASPDASPFDKVAPAPEVQLGGGAVTYESCMRSCSFKWQSADLAGTEISQGKQKCTEGCARYAKEGGGIVAGAAAVKPRAAPFSSSGPSPAAELGAGHVEYEACLRSCSFEWQSAGLASTDVSQGKQRCEEGCAQAAQEGAGIVVKRTSEHTSTSAAKAKVSFTTFEGCMESCKGKEQHADIAFDISQGKFDCESECARYASAGSKTIVKKGGLPLVGDLLGDVSGSPSKTPAKTPTQASSSLEPPKHVSSGPGFEAFDGCMSRCKGKQQTADIAFEISQGKFDCESECARYVKVETGAGGRP